MRKIVFVLIALLLVSGAALAQDDMATFCGDLSEEDCSLLTQSEEAMKNLSSAAFDLNADLTVTGLPELEGDLTFALTGNGAFSGHMMEMGSMEDMADQMQDPAAMMGMAVEALRSFSGDLSLTLDLPAAVLEEAEDMPESITLELRMVEGVGYLNTDTLTPLMGEDADQMEQMGMSGWVGLDIAGFLEAMVEQNPDMFEGMEMFGADASLYQQFGDPSVFAEFVSISRTDDGSGDTATFETVVNLSDLFTSSTFQDMMAQQMEAQGADMSDEEVQQAMEAVQALYADSEVTSTTTIEIATGYVTSTTFNMSFDMSSMMEMMATPEADMEMTAAPAFTLNAAVNFSQFNEVEEITAPEDANVIPFESLLGMMGGMEGMEGEGMIMTPTPTPGS